MIKRFVKKIGLLCLLYLLLPTLFTNAEDNLSVIDKVTDTETQHVNWRIQFIGSNPGKVWDNIHKAHDDLNFSERWAGGILEIDDIVNYLVLVVQFLSQLGLVVGVIFIMYAGYKYMLSIFNGGKVPSSTLKNAIIGVIIVVFSYAIMKILTSFIGLT